MISLDELFKFCIEFSGNDQTDFARYNESATVNVIKFSNNGREQVQ